MNHWEPYDGRPRSLSGVKLEGNRLLRFIYMDEAGISRDEAVTVVVGVVVDGDRQFSAIEAHIQTLIEKYVPVESRKGFSFHAKELANGGKTFSKSDSEKRLAALKEVAQVPAKFMLPVVIGYVKKSSLPTDRAQTEEKRAILAQAMAYAHCAIAAENFMRKVARLDEVALCVAEDNSSARRAIKAAHASLKDPSKAEMLKPMSGEGLLPVKRIVDTVHFAQKQEAVMLQIADVCAYIVKRVISGAAHASELFKTVLNGVDVPAGWHDYGSGHYLIHRWDNSEVTNSQAWLSTRILRPLPSEDSEYKQGVTALSCQLAAIS